MIGDEAIGAIRAYTSEKWEFTLDDVNFVQALAQIAGFLIEMTGIIQLNDRLKLKKINIRKIDI